MRNVKQWKGKEMVSNDEEALQKGNWTDKSGIRQCGKIGMKIECWKMKRPKEGGKEK